MKHTRSLAVLSAVLFGCGALGFGDDVAETEKKIVAAWAKVKSYTSKNKTTSDPMRSRVREAGASGEPST